MPFTQLTLCHRRSLTLVLTSRNPASQPPAASSQLTTMDIRNATSSPTDSTQLQNILPQHLANLLLQAGSQVSVTHRSI